MLRIEILLDVVGTSGYRCGVLRSFSMEIIKKGNERVLSLFSPSSSNGVGLKRYHIVPYGELNGIPVALVARFGVISMDTNRIHVSMVVDENGLR
ncbi:hypothetical protein Tco_1543807, partial [Tanacetum coccineum]